MAAAAFDIQASVGKNRAQSDRRVEIKKTVDFSVVNGNTGLDAAEDVAFMTTPTGFVFERCDGILKTAEGAAGNIDIGTEADPDGMLDGGDVNGTINESIAPAGTEAIVSGTYMSETEVRITIAAAQPTVDAAVVDITLVGYITD